MKKKCIVTGGAGFIGSHIVDLLVEKGHEVAIIDNFSGGSFDNISHHEGNLRVSIFEKDICNLSPTEKIFDGADWVFHFAGLGDIVPSIEKPTAYFETNVFGTLKVLEVCRNFNIEKFVYAASSSCYGIAKTPTSEEHAINCEYPYAMSKYQGEQLSFHWAKVYGFPCCSIRIFNAFGPRSKTTGAYGAVFGVFLKQKLAGKPYTVVGDGTQSRDFVYVTDVAKAFYLAALEGVSGECYNLGCGQPKSVNKLIECLGGGDHIQLPNRPGEPYITHADISKIKDELGWSAEIDFEIGVEKMLENIEYWQKAPLWDEKSIEKATKTWFNYLKD